jgi:hypothetical protein
MKYIRTLVLVCTAAASLFAPAGAAAMKPADQIRPWLGTWSCKAANNNHTAVFTPVFGGNAMRISESGKVPSEEIVTWDAKHKKWIDQYADASGMYNTMEGTPAGKSINFKVVYPSGGPSLLVTMQSKNTFTTAFSASMNGKTIQERETCTRM